MPDRITSKTMYASLAGYLEDLQESGVEGVPVAIPREPHPDTPKNVSHVKNLEELACQVQDCTKCGLSAERKRVVFGQGNPKARLVLVGEAPGAEEDRQGIPFVGDAGMVLTRLLKAMGLSREDVYICNVIKCRPPGNRNPHKDEIVACSGYLKQQLELINPQVLVALGTFAAQTLLATKEPISRMRGHFHPMPGHKNLPVMPTFHPAFLLRNQENREHFWEVWDDMTKVLAHLGLPIPDKQRR